MIGLIAMAIGAGVSMYGSYKQGQYEDDMAKYNAEVATENAKAEASALSARREMETDQSRASLASARASASTKGIDATQGSPLLGLVKEAQIESYDMMELKRQEDITLSRGRAESSLLLSSGKAAKSASYWNMGSTAVSAAGNIYSAGSQMDWSKPSAMENLTASSKPSRSLLGASLGVK